MADYKAPGVNADVTDDTPFEALSEKSLTKAGVAYLIGDGSLAMSGLLSGRYKEASSGLLWGVGGLACARYGNPDAEKKLELLSCRLRNYLQRQGVAIPENPDTKLLCRKDGLVDHIEDFLYKYPSQVLNTAYAIGGLQLFRSGLEHSKRWDAASGALISTGALAGLLIPEKKPDPDHPPEGTIEKAKAWLQEKPLRISGALYTLNNATLVASALGERKANPQQKSYLFKFLTAASYIFGNAMLAMSSKDHGNALSGGNKAMERLADASARVIAAQAPQIQEALVHEISGFLAAQPDVPLKAEQIAEMLHGKLANVQSHTAAPSPWQARAHAEGPTNGHSL